MSYISQLIITIFENGVDMSSGFDGKDFIIRIQPSEDISRVYGTITPRTKHIGVIHAPTPQFAIGSQGGYGSVSIAIVFIGTDPYNIGQLGSSISGFYTDPSFLFSVIKSSQLSFRVISQTIYFA